MQRTFVSTGFPFLLLLLLPQGQGCKNKNKVQDYQSSTRLIAWVGFTFLKSFLLKGTFIKTKTVKAA
jgi:hypothetical protein